MDKNKLTLHPASNGSLGKRQSYKRKLWRATAYGSPGASLSKPRNRTLKKILAASMLLALATSSAYAWPQKKFTLVNNMICRGCSVPLIVTSVILTAPGVGSFTAQTTPPQIGPNGGTGTFMASQDEPCLRYVAVNTHYSGPVHPAANNQINVCTQSKITISVSGAGFWVFTYN